MTHAAQAHAPRLRMLRVGTQLANLPALRSYERMGFRVTGSSHVFHLHLEGKARAYR
jgi:hypothetical protein